MAKVTSMLRPHISIIIFGSVGVSGPAWSSCSRFSRIARADLQAVTLAGRVDKMDDRFTSMRAPAP
eukprot:2084178-Pyramimonas_sp.AAC.1